jgi:hypothetical protein
MVATQVVRHGGGVRRGARDRAHIRLLGAAAQIGQRGEIGTCCCRGAGGELVGGEFLQRLGHLVNRIIRARQGAVAAGVGGREFIGSVKLFAGFNPDIHALAAQDAAAAVIDVQHQVAIH